MTQLASSKGRRLSIWALASMGAIGVLVGISLFTFGYARGASYFSDDPQTCMNCHVMREQFEAWNHSSHKAVATCNDCHTPHDSLVSKWFVKGLNGFNHSVAFTTGSFDDPIHIRDFNADVVQENCIACHETAVSQILGVHAGDAPACVQCHAGVGHSTRE
jgi:cytochrome c nitrite reductase small subunit